MKISNTHQHSRILKRTVSFALASTLLIPSLMGQEWQLGHQPQQYSVPQYVPDNGSSFYPVPQDDGPVVAAPHNTLEPLENIQPLPSTEIISGQLSSPRPPGFSTQPPTENTIVPGQVAPIELKPALQRPEPAYRSNPALTPAPSAAAPTSNSPPHGEVSKQNQSNLKTASGKRLGLDYSIYRDYNSHPVDPRKPCNQCTHPAPKAGLCNCQWPGKNGQPYREREPGGCDCSKANCKHHGSFSINWPGPFSALREAHQKEDQCGNQCSDPNRKRINDRFDHLANWKLINYKRSDTGYSGINADPYGCEGESRVAGLQFRQPGQSVNDSFGAYPLR